MNDLLAPIVSAPEVPKSATDQEVADLDEDLLFSKDTGRERRDLLWGEYKIIQDKLDRIGDFRFRVKQWSVTLVLGLVVGGAASSIQGWLLALCGFVVVVGFGLMEVYYHWTHGVLAARLRRIEYFLALFEIVAADGTSSRRRIEVEVSAPTPATAASIVRALERKNRKHFLLATVILRPSIVFYCLLAVIVLAMGLAQGSRTKGSAADESEPPKKVAPVASGSSTNSPVRIPNAQVTGAPKTSVPVTPTVAGAGTATVPTGQLPVDAGAASRPSSQAPVDAGKP